MRYKMYDFKCLRCGHEFEALVRPDDEWEECPECRDKAEKVIGMSNLGFMNQYEKRTEALKKRSYEHTMREKRRGNMPTERD